MMRKKKNAKDARRGAPTIRARMTRDNVDTIAMLLCLSRRLRSRAKGLVTRDLFKADEAGAAFVADLALRMASDYVDVDILPHGDLVVRGNSEASQPGTRLSAEVWEDVFAGDEATHPGLLHWAYNNITPGMFTARVADDLLDEFLNERRVDSLVKSLTQYGSDSVIGNWGEILRDVSAIDAANKATKGYAWRTLDQVAKDFRPIELLPTKLPFFDDFVGGGMAPTELYGITGGTGWGKSTLVHQLGLLISQVLQVRATGNGLPKSVLTFSYEDPEQRIFLRSMAYSARIKKSVLEKLTDPEKDLLRVRSDYDKALADSEDEPIEGYPTEYGRYRAALKTLRANYAFTDMTIDDRGDGGVDEIVALIDSYHTITGQQPGLVVIDSIDLLVDNYLVMLGRDPQRETPSEIPRCVHAIRKQIAIRWSCPVVIVNQLAGSYLGRTSQTLGHDAAGGSKSWGKALDFHWTLCRPTLDKVSSFYCSKSRRCPSEGKYAMIQLEGEFGRWRYVGDTFTVHNGAIVNRAAVDAIHGPVKHAKADATQGEFYE